jgi:hypothetical protein
VSEGWNSDVTVAFPKSLPGPLTIGQTDELEADRKPASPKVAKSADRYFKRGFGAPSAPRTTGGCVGGVGEPAPGRAPPAAASQGAGGAAPGQNLTAVCGYSVGRLGV